MEHSFGEFWLVCGKGNSKFLPQQFRNFVILRLRFRWPCMAVDAVMSMCQPVPRSEPVPLQSQSENCHQRARRRRLCFWGAKTLWRLLAWCKASWSGWAYYLIKNNLSSFGRPGRESGACCDGTVVSIRVVTLSNYQAAFWNCYQARRRFRYATEQDVFLIRPVTT